MNLVFDIGNTRCKAAVFHEEILLESAADVFSLDFIQSWLTKYPEAKYAFASVINLTAEEAQFFDTHRIINIKCLELFPLKADYSTPETLGDDRLAAVCGASFLSKNSFPFMVVQAGTAITFDYVDSTGHYIGGAISPGIKMRFDALHNFTGKLPLLKPTSTFSEMGQSTNSSIISGVMLGSLAEVKYRIDSFRNSNNEAPIFVAGGDSIYFEVSSKNHIFAVPNIVTIGLNYLLNINS